MNSTFNIANGLRRLRKEVHGNNTSLPEFLRLHLLFGIHAAQMSTKFKKWVLSIGMTKSKFKAFIIYALKEEDNKLINFDGETLCLKVPFLQGNYHMIWFEAYHFESYIGSQYIDINDLIETPGGGVILLTPEEYLQSHWKKEVLDFIMNNLHRAEVEVSDD